jgi:hypothetical protein
MTLPTLPIDLIQFILEYFNEIWVLRFLQNEMFTKMVVNKKNCFVQKLEDHWKHRITNYRTYYEEGTRYGKLYDKIIYYIPTPTQDIAVAFEYNCIISYGYIEKTYYLTDKYYEDEYEDIVYYYEKVKYFACLTKFV